MGLFEVRVKNGLVVGHPITDSTDGVQAAVYLFSR